MIKITSLIVFIVLLSACGGGQNTKHRAQTRTLQQITENVIIDGYAQISTALTKLDEQASNFCNTSTQQNLQALREQWRLVKTAHAFTEAFAFGQPVNALDNTISQSRSRRLYIRSINIAQTHARIEGLILGAEPINEDLIANSNITIQGLQALELLLFHNSSATLDNFTVSATANRRCQYLQAAVDNLTTIVANIQVGWQLQTNSFADEFVKAGDNSKIFATREQAFAALLEPLVFLIQQMRDAKLRLLIESQNPDDAESSLALQSLNNYQANLNGIFAVYTGDFIQEGIHGIDTLLAEKIGEPIKADNINVQFQKAFVALEQINQPFSKAITTPTGRAKLDVLLLAIMSLTERIELDLVPIVSGEDVRFNFNDGD